MATIQEVLRELGVEFLEAGHHHCRPGWIQTNCPFCHSNKFHLGYNLQAGYFNCWKCGAKHPIQVLTKFGLPYPEVKNFLEGRQLSPGAKERPRTGLKEPRGRGELQSAHRRYLKGRGFDPSEMEKLWGVEGIGLSSRLKWRIYLPIVYRGERVSWTARAIGDKVTQRYISASAQEEAVNHKHLIYGGDYCLHSIVIVEGPTDAWRIGPGAGALFGTAFSAAQVRKLSSVPHRFICFDSAPEAQREARKLADQLSCFPGETVNLEIDAKDPGSAPEKEINLIRRVAKLS